MKNDELIDSIERVKQLSDELTKIVKGVIPNIADEEVKKALETTVRVMQRPKLKNEALLMKLQNELQEKYAKITRS